MVASVRATRLIACEKDRPVERQVNKSINRTATYRQKLAQLDQTGQKVAHSFAGRGEEGRGGMRLAANNTTPKD